MQAVRERNPIFESDSCKASSFAAEVETRRKDTATSKYKRFSFDQHTHRLIWTFRYRPSETAQRLQDRLIWRRNSVSIISLKSYNNPYAILIISANTFERTNAPLWQQWLVVVYLQINLEAKRRTKTPFANTRKVDRI